MNIFYFAVPTLIWGSTWLVITFQLGPVDPLVSVLYRFSLAAAILMAYCLVSGRRMRFPLRDHLFMGMQGVLLFAFNYWLFYLAEQHITSGLAALTFSTIVFWNIVNGALLLREPVRVRVVLGGVLGLAGMALVFAPELGAFSLEDRGLLGLSLSLVATFSASLGNIASTRNQRAGVPVVQSNAYGMTYGALFLLFLSLALGKEFAFSATFPYVASVLYLALFGSVAAFGAYLSLLGRIGPDRGAYVSLVSPLVALALSTFFESFQWSLLSVGGVLLVMVGNLLALKGIRGRPRPQPLRQTAG